MRFPFFGKKKRSSVENKAKKAGVVFGENNSFASCFWTSAEPYLIKIGSNCQITADVKIFTHGGSQVARTIYPKFDCFGKVEIGDNVYIGNNSLIMPGVSIGDNVLVAAGSVVCQSVPSGVVVGGDPAHIICTVEEYIERNKPYNLNTKGLSRSKKKKILLATGEEMFFKKKFMQADLFDKSKGYEFLYNVCEQYHENKTKFTDIELQAISTLAKYADGKLSRDDFGEAMMSIGDDFKNLLTDDDGNYLLDNDVPGWLNLFLGNKFVRWNKVRLMVNAASQKPEMINDPKWINVKNVVEQEDKVLMSAVKYCLDEWKKRESER